MNISTTPVSQASGRDCWIPTLQLSMQEVFQLMLSCSLELPPEAPVEEGLDITAW